MLLCVPDGAIAEVADGIAPGPVGRARERGHAALGARAARRRFSVHPLQTFTRRAGPSSSTVRGRAVTAETDEARETGFALARTLGLRPFALADEARPLYHAGAAIASNYLVTLHRAASRLFRDAGAPPEGLVPLMRRTIENGFELTGPISRGDWTTVDAHLDAIRAREPDLESMYVALAEATRP